MMKKTNPMIFENRLSDGRVHRLRACKLQNGKFTVEFLKHGSTEWKPGIVFPKFKSKRSVEKWLSERYEKAAD